jgi:hypothetical protein
MEATRPESTALYFDIPDNMKKVLMDPMTGHAAVDGDDGAVKALFVDGTEPKGR